MLKNILLLQHDIAESNAVRDVLCHLPDTPYRVAWLRFFRDASEHLGTDYRKPDAERTAAILVNLFLPDSVGIETFDSLAAAAPQIPILILTASHNEDVAKLAVRRGAYEYVIDAHSSPAQLTKTVSRMIERTASREALFDAQERAQVTLDSIGDAVVCTDVFGNVTYLNRVAETLTGWPERDATGRPLSEVFRIIDGTTRAVARNPMEFAIQENKTVSLTPNCVLIRRDGVESPIEDSAAPIHDRNGRVTGAVMVFHDVGDARAISLRMAHLARHDNLTDLPNRLLLNERLTEAITLAHRYRRNLAVLFLDLDRFKHINDSLGHAIGDRLLQSIARRLLDCVRASDTVSRQGGDEFVILLSEVSNTRDATACADKILAVCRIPHLIDQHVLHVTASIGIVCYPDDGADADTLMKHADFAMYQAKERGRNNRQFFKHDLNDRAVERQSLQNALRDALEREEFTLRYQPKVNLETGAIVGVEALIRWVHPDLGAVPPAQFIPVAEESGLIVPIGRWVFAEVCHQAKAWQEIGLPLIRVSINISAVELRANDFVEFVTAVLDATGLQSRFLELELTETFLMQDSKTTSALLRALKQLGLNLALDDFGTGFSSLSHLKRFPIDTLKIDRSFVQGITVDSGDASIVGAVISMGSNLRMRVVAEGVETREQFTFLRDRGCPFGQGYYFSQPVTARACVPLLQQGFAMDRPPN